MKILSMIAAAGLVLATAGMASAQTTPGYNQKAAGEGGGQFNTLAGGANNQKAAGEGGGQFNTLAGGANNQKAAGEGGSAFNPVAGNPNPGGQMASAQAAPCK
jgi:hypothetical protein